MAPQIRYDSEWEEVKVINAYVVLTVYVSFAMRGVGYLVITWTTVVLLGGFVSVIDNADFWRLTLITLMQILWMHAPSLLQKLLSIRDLFHRIKTVNNMLKRNWVQADNPGADDPGQPIIVAMVGFVITLIHKVVLYMCIGPLYSAVVFGMFISTWTSIRGLMQHDYRGHTTDEGRTNMAAAHNVLHVLCVVQGALWLLMLVRSKKVIVKQVSRAYGFEDGGHAIGAYLEAIMWGHFNKPSSAKGRNLITYALELMESKVPSMCLSGILILEKLLTRQHLDKIKTPSLMKQYEKEQQQQLQDNTGPIHLNKKERVKEEKHQEQEEEIIRMQHKVIKWQIGSASYTHVLQKLLETLEPRNTYDLQMRDGAATIVEHVADVLRLEQFPQGIRCISSLLNTFEEYSRLQQYQLAPLSNTNEGTKTTLPSSPHTTSDHDEQGSNTVTALSKSQPLESESDNVMELPLSSKANKSKTNPFHSYKELVLTDLRILRVLARRVDNCIIISNTKHLVSKIMAPVSYDLVHRTHHSVWSTRVVEGSLGVILLLMASDGETRAKMLQRISRDDKAMTTMERIIRCEECKDVNLQMKAMLILTPLCLNGETESRVNFTKLLLSIFTNSNNNDVLIRTTAGQALEMFFFGNRSVGTTPSTANNDASEFIGGLVNIVSQVGDKETCRKYAVETLERLCIRYTDNNENLCALKESMARVMPMVLGEILLGYGSIEGNPMYAGSGADVESQVPIDGGSTASQVNNNNNKNNNNSSSAPEKKQDHSLHVSLLSLCLTACEILHLEFHTMNPLGGSAAFGFARKMVQLNGDLTVDCLTMMKLSTRMVIEMMKHRGIVEPANLDLESLMNSLSSVSETMLDLESSMVFATNKHATSRTLDSMVREARELHDKIKEQDLAIV